MKRANSKIVIVGRNGQVAWELRQAPVSELPVNAAEAMYGDWQ
jgi:dTDP-4-dehydrorhamnose reductase